MSDFEFNGDVKAKIDKILSANRRNGLDAETTVMMALILVVDALEKFVATTEASTARLIAAIEAKRDR